MMFSAKLGGSSSRTAHRLLCCCLVLLMISAGASTAEEVARKTAHKRAETAQEVGHAATQTAGTQIPVPTVEGLAKTPEEKTETKDEAEQVEVQTTESMQTPAIEESASKAERVEEGFKEPSHQPAGQQTVDGEEDTTQVPTTDESTSDLCDKPLPPENGFIKGDNYSYEAVVRVECERGYRLTGTRTLTCRPVPYPGAPGIWAPQEEYSCLPTTRGTDLTPSHDIFEGETFDDIADNTHLTVSPAPPCLLPSREQHSTGSEFNPRLHTSAGRLTDTEPDTQAVEGLLYLCSLPAVRGPCRETIPRFFFDAAKLECFPFTYSGCYGNDNNFETFESCQSVCR